MEDLLEYNEEHQQIDEKVEETPRESLNALTLVQADTKAFELKQREAKLLASSTLVPKAYQGNIADVVVAMNMANRLGADPLMVM